VLTEDAPGEAVERADRRAVEVVEGGAAAQGPLTVAFGRGRSGLVVELLAHPVAQLGGGLLGERDGGQLVDARGAGGDEADDAVDQCTGLARARSRLHEESGVQAVGDVVAGSLVGWEGDGRGECAAHGRTPSASRA
jgi:hypothetical protein